MIDFPLNGAGSLLANQQEFLVSCVRQELFFVIDISKVGADVLLCCTKELRHHRLGQPDGFVLEADVQSDAPLVGLVDNDFAVGGHRFISRFCWYSRFASPARFNIRR
jgi:hypothetical protein